MREEEPPADIMRICIGVAVLVMHSVVPRPHEDGVLHGAGVEQH